MNIEQEIRAQIEKNKGLKLAVGEINNHLSVLEELVRKDITERVDEAYKKGLHDGESKCRYCNEYQRGLDDAWEAAKKIVCDDELDWNTLLHIFNRGNFDGIFGDFSPSEAIAKLKAYEEKQKADDEIKVGDEVAFHHDDGRPDTVVVVTYIGQDGFIDGMDGRGTQYAHKNPTKWTKTGRHFDIDKILGAMKE